MPFLEQGWPSRLAQTPQSSGFPNAQVTALHKLPNRPISRFARNLRPMMAGQTMFLSAWQTHKPPSTSSKTYFPFTRIRLDGCCHSRKVPIALYGRIICRCEMITEGEIVAAIKSPVGAVDLDGVKRRTRAGMGRCQSGFCSPRVTEILSRELGIPMTDVRKNGGCSYILTGKTR